MSAASLPTARSASAAKPASAGAATKTTATPTATPAQAAEKEQWPKGASENDPDQNEGDHNPGNTVLLLVLGLRRLRLAAEVDLVAGDEPDDLHRALLHPSVVVAGAKLRQDGVFDDDAAGGVGEV